MARSSRSCSESRARCKSLVLPPSPPFRGRGEKAGALAVLLLCLTSSARAAPTISAAAFAPDGKSVVVGSQAGIEVHSWPELRSLRKLTTKLAHIHDLTFSPASDVLAAAGGAPAEEGAIELFRWPSGELLKRVTEHTDLVYAVAWRGDGRRLATASADGTCRVRDAATGKCAQIFKGHSRPGLAVAWTPDGQQVLSAGIDQSLRLWVAGSGRARRGARWGRWRTARAPCWAWPCARKPAPTRRRSSRLPAATGLSDCGSRRSVAWCVSSDCRAPSSPWPGTGKVVGCSLVVPMAACASSIRMLSKWCRMRWQ